MADFIGKVSISEGYDGEMVLAFMHENGYEVVSYEARDADEARRLLVQTLPMELQQTLNANNCLIGRDIVFESEGCFGDLQRDYNDEYAADLFCDIYIGNATNNVQTFAEYVCRAFPEELIPVDNIAFKGGSWGLCLDIHGLYEGNIYYNAATPQEAVELFNGLAEVLAEDLENAGMCLGNQFYIRYEDGFQDLEYNCAKDMVANAFADMYNDGFSEDADYIGRQVAALML